MSSSSASKGTSFRQYQHCSLCKLNHTSNKKHIYSKRHQQILQSILTKFSDKIHSVRKDLFNPRVNSEDFEVGAKFWCYFCKEEINKHELMENCTVIGGGLLQHIACTEHKSNMEQFFWDNLLKKELKPKYILPMEDLLIYKKAVFLAVKKWQKSESSSRKLVAESIAYVEHHRWSESANRTSLMGNAPTSCGTSQRDSVTSCSGTSQQDAVTSCGTSQRDSVTSCSGTSLLGATGSTQSSLETFTNTGLRRTVSAKSEGLTCILKQDNSSSDDGNIHTGALPPWLRGDTDTSQKTQIGPTMEDYQKHVEREKKAKLPANRVGANFDHTADRSQDWLPSFGRVWSKGRRLQSKQHFERNWKKDTGSVPYKMKLKMQPWSSNSSDSARFHTNSKNNSDWSDSHASANQTVSYNTSSADNIITNQVIPYKRKSSHQNVTSHMIGGIYPTHSVIESTNQSIPYKRRMTNDSAVTLIQTPILHSSEHK